ncbi:MAG: peptidase M28 [Ectothiorhodospiraceae bacterium]|nr:peptidase M28 [Ectothiorhodospiraceae bacterium]
MKYAAVILVFAVALGACSTEDETKLHAIATITEDDLSSHIEVLASDEFQGRMPGTEGETRTIEYLTKEFKRIGAKPGNGDSYTQEMELISLNPSVYDMITVEGEGGRVSLNYKDEFVAVSTATGQPAVISNAELVFAGFGIVAPEYGWNDYQGIDMEGKIAVVLVNDPGFYTQDSSFFNGRAMTYYGRWTYKYEEAARQGASGIFIVHETAPAGYPWQIVRKGWTGPQMYINKQEVLAQHCGFEGWINHEKAKEIFALAGEDYERMKDLAVKGEAGPTPLGLTTTLSITNTTETLTTSNVLALIEGSERPDEVIVYTAHWDHFGVDPSLEQEDKIYNGARDNATGTSALLELAEAFASLPKAPARSVLLLAVTAEEQGLLGSKYYVEHPVFPMRNTIAVINLDGLNIFGPMNDITLVGYGQSELDAYAENAAARQSRVVKPDPEPEKGRYFRSDHFNFIKHGVPAMYPSMGFDHREKGADYAREKANEWVEVYYHEPSDNYEPEWWDLRGAVEDIQLVFDVGYMLATSSHVPGWNAGSEFKAIREESFAKK